MECVARGRVSRLLQHGLVVSRVRQVDSLLNPWVLVPPVVVLLQVIVVVGGLELICCSLQLSESQAAADITQHYPEPPPLATFSCEAS